MKIYEVNERTDLVPVFMNIWEASVWATHHFLSTGEIEQIKAYVPQTIKGVEHLVIAENESGTPIQTYKRTECDEEGNPYPLIYMKRNIC